MKQKIFTLLTAVMLTASVFAINIVATDELMPESPASSDDSAEPETLSSDATVDTVPSETSEDQPVTQPTVQPPVIVVTTAETTAEETITTTEETTTTTEETTTTTEETATEPEVETETDPPQTESPETDPPEETTEETTTKAATTTAAATTVNTTGTTNAVTTDPQDANPTPSDSGGSENSVLLIVLGVVGAIIVFVALLVAPHLIRKIKINRIYRY